MFNGTDPQKQCLNQYYIAMSQTIQNDSWKPYAQSSSGVFLSQPSSARLTSMANWAGKQTPSLCMLNNYADEGVSGSSVREFYRANAIYYNRDKSPEMHRTGPECEKLENWTRLTRGYVCNGCVHFRLIHLLTYDTDSYNLLIISSKIL